MKQPTDQQQEESQCLPTGIEKAKVILLKKFWSKPEGVQFKVLNNRDISIKMRKDEVDANVCLILGRNFIVIEKLAEMILDI